MKTNRTLLVALAVIFACVTLTSCGGGKKKAADKTRAQAVTTVYEVDEVVAGIDDKVGQTITLEGVCTHICKHGGGKIFLMGSDDTKTIRVEAGKKIGSFKQETVNSIVRVTGTLCEQRIDEDYLTDWEEQLKAQTAENHGDGEEGCSSEQQARGEASVNSTQERIDNFRTRIAERKEKEGKEYLSFYYVEASDYTIE